MRLLVTRPAAQGDAWVNALRALGVDAQPLPLIGIEPVAEAGAAAAVQAAWGGLGDCAFVMFVSANAVTHFFAAAAGQTWPAGVRAGSTGPGTTAALRAAGVPQPMIDEPAPDAPQFDTEALWSRIGGRPWRGCRVLIVRGEGGRDWLAQTLREAGASVDFVAAYRRVAPAWSDAEHARLAEARARPAMHAWLFSSSEAVRHLAGLAPAGAWATSRALATHPRIAQTARDAGFGQVLAVAATPEAVAQALAGGSKTSGA